MIYLEKKSVRWCYQITKTTIKVNKIPQVPSILSLLLLWFFYLNLKYVNFECWKQEYDRMIKCWFHIKYVHFFCAHASRIWKLGQYLTRVIIVYLSKYEIVTYHIVLFFENLCLLDLEPDKRFRGSFRWTGRLALNLF